MRHTNWAEDYLRDMGFRPCEAYPDLWMRMRRRKADCYEYVAVMVDDLLVFSQEPELIMEQKAAAATTIPTNTLLAISPTMMPPMITPAPPIPPEPPPRKRSDSLVSFQNDVKTI